MNAIRVAVKVLSHYVYPFVSSLLAAFVLSFVLLNIVTTYQSIDLYGAQLWQMLAVGLLGFVWLGAALWLAYRKKRPLLSANLSLALVLGNALMLEDSGDATSMMLCAVTWAVLSLVALGIYWAANKLSAAGKATASCVISGVGSLVFVSLVAGLVAMLL